MDQHRRLTTNQGVPIGDNANSITAGRRGPTLLEDYQLIEKLAHFDRERVPERVVHARGAGAHGVFKVKNSMKRYTKAKFLQEEGQETPIFARFSTVIHGLGSPETLRDPRGFSVKFYTEEGNYDFVGNNLPVFFIRDAIKFPDVIHSLKPDPRTNLQDPDRFFDFMSLTPESTSMLIHLFSDEGIPASYRHMRGSSVHSFKWVNEYGNTVYIKLRWVPKQGVKNLSMEDAAKVQAEDFNHATRDLFNAIEEGDFPEWDLYVQILDPADMDNFDFDPLDATKDWFEDVIPYQLVGTMTLNKNVDNYFAETESVGFNPGVLVPGIQPSEDKMLQGRLFSYSDTQRYRIGANYLQLPINCPFAQVSNNQRDGVMPFKQQTSPVNYEPNRYEDAPKPDAAYIETEQPLSGVAGRQKIEKTNDFGQAGEVYRRYSEEEKTALVNNLVAHIKEVRHENTVLLLICNFYRADRDLGARLSEALNVDITPFLSQVTE
ncbi:MAG: catalase [Exiguobacterium chiriqhucha]|jgi:catalase|uniref:Catalase n=2 Tax=Bacteria TaxID=2 RepID=U1LXT3_9BACL|nr:MULTISPECIES: catalase [Exiguobacterium]ERG67117.1 catalase [Exiguobacterium chiriqhucha RW-2]KAB2863763.1 MAG: catalase [Exiguobacterium chiriqhucha]TCI68973.1 catalase [Exiguobacterium sp. IPCI3]TCI78470.1 catalase [Exiguobacterium sp. IPCH1]TCI79727.1 catalase [Exiguobacterium sp. IPBC4]